MSNLSNVNVQTNALADDGDDDDDDDDAAVGAIAAVTCLNVSTHCEALSP